MPPTQEHKMSRGLRLWSRVYDAAFLLFGLAYLPFFLAKLRQAESAKTLLSERLGRCSRELEIQFAGKKVLWIHAVSVGEVMAVRKLIESILNQMPEVSIFLTTVTPTGQRVAKEMACERVQVAYYPFDLTFAVRRVLHAVRPRAILLVETELWPNLLSEAQVLGIPVGILNARLSEKSARRYARFWFCFKPLFEKLSFVLAQNEEDAAKFEMLGVEGSQIEVLGNMKFDNVPAAGEVPEAPRRAWGLRPEDMVLMGGSTHPGEEDKLLEAFLALRESYPSLKLVLAPRHIERSAKLDTVIRQLGLKCRRWSGTEPADFDVLLLDQLGILKKLYAIADVVFVGGSWNPRGGQNPMEPASWGRPILHGPHVSNFNRIYGELDQEGAAFLVRDVSEFVFVARQLLGHAGEREQVGQKAFQIVRQFQGATQRHLERIRQWFGETRKEGLVHENVFSSSRRGT